MCIVDSHRHLIALFKYFKCEKELRLPDPASLSLQQNGTIHVNQRVRLPNEVKANRETCIVWKNACASYYMPGQQSQATPEEKQIHIRIQKWNNKCISQQRIFRRLAQW